MKLSEVQSAIAAKLVASTALAGLGVPIQYSLFTADENARVAIQAALLATGVCMEIGPVGAPMPADNPMPNQTFPRAECSVFVAESRTIAHTPSGVELAEAVIGAVCTSLSRGQLVFKFNGYEAAVHEDGYVLHIINFEVPVTVAST